LLAATTYECGNMKDAHACLPGVMGTARANRIARVSPSLHVQFITGDAVMPEASSPDGGIREGEPCVERSLVYSGANVAEDNPATSAWG
jgi:hypothetical protein